MNDRGSLVHRDSSLFFLPVKSTDQSTAPEPSVDEFTSYKKAVPGIADEEVEPDLEASTASTRRLTAVDC